MHFPKIYFFTCPEFDNYQDDIIPLAEGLNELNIPFYSLNNYWLQSEKENDYLFKSTPDVHFSECDIVIFPYTWFNWVTIDRPTIRRDFPKDLFQSGRKYKVVYFDFNDGYRTVSWEKQFRQFDAIFRCKYNEKMYHPVNMIPWALGFSNRVLKMLSPSTHVNGKKYEVLSNFGASHPYEHQLRRKMRLEYLPLLSGSFKVNSVIDNLKIEPVNMYDKLMWKQTNQRHSAGYYDRLRNHLISLCFCGDLVSSLPYDPSSILMHGNKGRIKRVLFSGLSSMLWQRHTRIVQWDSWRFWETLVAKSVPVHIDLVTHGVKLPVMPENKIHYIGVDLSNYRDSIDFMREEKGKLLEIGARGHDWAMEHYSPIATAKRFLMKMGYEI